MKTQFELDRILNTVCCFYNIKKEDIISKNRHEELIKPRQVYFYFGFIFTNYKSHVIADFINRHKATAIYARDKIENQKQIYKDLQSDLNSIEKMLYSTIIPMDVNLLEMTINYTKSFIS